MNTFILYLSHIIFGILPETRCFQLKAGLLRMSGARIGRNVRICSSVRVYGNGHLSIGDNTWVGHNCFIMCSADVTIGHDVNIAPCCYIGTGTHEIDLCGESIAGKGKSIPIIIGNGAWICASSTILAGSIIGKKSIIAAGAVVKGIVEDCTLVGGVIAKKIKDIEGTTNDEI